MSITLREASEKVGVTRQTLMKAIKTGRVSGQKSDNGEWRIEPVELFRVWPPVNEVQQPLHDRKSTRLNSSHYCASRTPPPARHHTPPPPPPHPHPPPPP